MELPVDQKKNEILAALKAGNRLVLRAPTGSGKSTRVPVFLLDAEAAIEGEILVVQPRRMAARLLAGHVASTLGEKCGDRVGFAVRFQRQVGPNTRVIYLTDGLLARRLSEDPNLDGVGAVVFDEFHERRLASDISLGKVRELQGKRPELKLVVMSATLDAGPISEFLDPCIEVETQGRSYPVEILYRSPGQALSRKALSSQRRGDELWDQVAKVAGEAAQMEDCGEILIFLPGAFEIRRTLERLGQCGWAKGFELRGLHGGMPPAEQDATLRRGNKPRIIASTNVAETSLTIDGIRTVIDSGLARMGSFEARREINTLLIEKISQASADQRAGRAGRTAPGRCFRLWSERDQSGRPGFTPPEVRRMDLSEAVLELKASGWPEVTEFPWLDAPEMSEIRRCERVLKVLGAVDREGNLTEIGVVMSRFGLPPRFSRLLLAGSEIGCLAEAAFVAAAVQGEDLFLGRGQSREKFAKSGDISDFAPEWRAMVSAQAAGFRPERCTELGLRARAARELVQSFEQLQQQCKRRGLPWNEPNFDENQSLLAEALLCAFADHLAVQGNFGNRTCRMSGGRKGKLDSESVVRGSEWLIVVEMVEVEAKSLQLNLRRATELTWEQLEPRLELRVENRFVEEGRKVARFEQYAVDDLVIKERESGEPDPDQAAAELARRVASGELILKKWNDGVEQFLARVNSLSEWMPELEIAPITEEDRGLLLEAVCRGATRYKQIKDREVMGALRDWLSSSQLAALDFYAPKMLKLENGREVKLRYAAGEPPKFGLQVQRLYGVKSTPSLCDGRVPIKIEILAPNQRPWQVTSDLKSFWSSGFEQMRKDLAGRYPKHNWEGPN